MAPHQTPAPNHESPKACGSEGFDPSRILHQRFEVQKLLGEGSYGKVYRSKRRSDGKLYAVKARTVAIVVMFYMAPTGGQATISGSTGITHSISSKTASA